MNQSIVSPLPEQKLNSTGEEGKKAFSKMGPLPVMLEIVDPNIGKVRVFVNRRVTAWRALPPQRKRVIALISGSVFLAVTMSLLAAGITRKITRKEAAKAIPLRK